MKKFGTPHHGGPCPVSMGTIVTAYHEYGGGWCKQQAGSIDWTYVTEYYEHKPKQKGKWRKLAKQLVEAHERILKLPFSGHDAIEMRDRSKFAVFAYYEAIRDEEIKK